MYLTDQVIIKETRHKALYDYLKASSQKANNLYNAVRFRQRQIFCGWDKEKRTPNEEEVFREVEVLREARPHIKVRKNISYTAMDALLRENSNPDYFAGLPMQSAQNVAKEAVSDFSSWLASLKKYGKDPSGYTGRPKMPKYCRPGGMHTYTITNQDAVLYPRTDTETGEYLGMELKLPLVKERLFLKHLGPDTYLKQVKVLQYPYNSFHGKCSIQQSPCALPASFSFLTLPYRPPVSDRNLCVPYWHYTALSSF